MPLIHQGSNGKLIGYSAGNGIETKKNILFCEEVFFKGDKADLAKSQWLQL